MNHNGQIGDRVGVFLTSIYKNMETNTMCKARIVNVLPIISQLPFNVQSEQDQVILHIEYVDESVKESTTPSNFEPRIPTYTLL